MAWLSRLGLATKPSGLRRIFPLRSYGSAAAVQYDYEEDYYYSEQEEEAASGRLPGRNEPCQGLAAGSTWGRGVQWVLIGEPRDKRRLYAEKLAKLLEVPHISMGSLLRQELNPGSSLYRQIANAVNEGKLVPEGVIFGLLSKRLEEGYCRGESGFILDGIPRTRIQAEILDQIADIDLALNFKSAEENLVKRDFLSMGNSKSSIADMENALKEKSRIYLEQGKALEDYYKKQKKLLDFQVGGAPGDTWQGLLAALHLKHLSAVSSTKKLTA